MHEPPGTPLTARDRNRLLESGILKPNLTIEDLAKLLQRQAILDLPFAHRLTILRYRLKHGVAHPSPGPHPVDPEAVLDHDQIVAMFHRFSS